MPVNPPPSHAPAPLEAAWWIRLLRTWIAVGVSTLAYVGRWARRLGRQLTWWWRSNLQFRVIVSTMVLCLVVMTFLLAFIYQQIAEGLVEGKTASARQEALFGTREIQKSLEQADRTDPESMNDLIGTMLRRAQQERTDSSQELIFTRSLASAQGPSRLNTIWTGVDLSVVPHA